MPRPAATPLQLRMAADSGYVAPPACPDCPGPMGIADYGLRNNTTTGAVQPYVLTTTSLEGNLTLGGGGIQPLYVLDSSPDAYSVQLNAALTNVTILGNSSYQFWTQSIAVYFPHLHQLDLESNVWNFSSDFLSNNSILGHGLNGKLIPGRFYMSQTNLTDVTSPFNLTLFLNSTSLAGNDGVNFSAVLRSSGVTHSYPFDFVTFNSVAAGVPMLVGPTNFTANGFAYNPIGLPDDFEFVIAGPGGGSQVDLFGAQASMSLRYAILPGVYETVPSALSYGGDSGESSTGVNVEWTTGSSGPYALLSTGPSILTGLWNASGPPGVATIQAGITPADAFVFVQPSPNSFTTSVPEWAPTALDTTLSVGPGTYVVNASMSYFTTATLGPMTLTAGQSLPFNPSLLPDPASEVTTPLYVWNDSQFPNISSGGLGTNASPFMIKDLQNAPMASMFGVMNDYHFPVFSGVFFAFTTRSAELYRPGPFETNLPYVGDGLPSTNDLSYTFYQVSNVSVVDAPNISGWFDYGLYFHPGNYSYATFNMVFWNSSHNLVASNTFQTESEGIYLYGGSSNTIWNNT
ncbi:MAG: thermopsin family protease, partial [Thermoplasmata archaeon]|nr:thermopsin family protease [Thermoplasmata archaeon]